MNAVCLTWAKAEETSQMHFAFRISRFEFPISNSHFANLFVQMRIKQARKLHLSLCDCDIPDNLNLFV